MEISNLTLLDEYKNSTLIIRRNCAKYHLAVDRVRYNRTVLRETGQKRYFAFLLLLKCNCVITNHKVSITQLNTSIKQSCTFTIKSKTFNILGNKRREKRRHFHKTLKEKQRLYPTEILSTGDFLRE